MGFKKHNWIKYGSRGYIVEIKLKESTGSKIDFLTYNSDDKKTEEKILDILNRKYGILTSSKKEKKKEGDWLKKDIEW